jgi:site-specific DNA-cytosine methylase
MPKFLELFAGAGGMTMGFEASGWECVGHAEIEPHARAVLRHKWPEVPLHGDVAQLDGTTLPRLISSRSVRPAKTCPSPGSGRG